jgi:uncharacterized protein DUF6545
MGELLLQYGPPLLAWGLFTSRRRREDGARQCVRRVLLGLAVSLTVLTPAGYAAVGQLSGIPDLPRLIGHGSMLFAAWAGQDFLAHMNGMQRGSRWHAWWIAGVFAVMCLLFALAPNLLAHSPWVFEYCVVYVVGQVPAFGNVIRLCLRYARLTDDPALRVALRLVVAGTTAALIYLVNKMVLAASARFDFAYPPGRTFLLSQLLPNSAHVLVLLGAAMPTLLGWLHRYRLYLRLRPLWQALYQADPMIALDPPTAPDMLVVRHLRLRLYRRVIEIRDGLLALQPYRDPHIAAIAREHAIRAGMNGQRLEAAIEAVTVVAALRSRAAGAPPAAPEVPITGGGDLNSDTTFLSQVARGYRKNHATR